MSQISAYSAENAEAPLAPTKIERRALGAQDVAIDILFCGVCHSDLHTARNDWGGTVYPIVPGHEIVGRVARVGAGVTAFKAGDLVGVGCLVDSCRTCSACAEHEEQYCEAGPTGTYSGVEKETGRPTNGGYSKAIVVDQHFVLRIPGNLDAAASAPLLCAGITLYSPLKHWHAGPGKRVGIVGLGGLGHMGVKLARAMGAHVVLFTTSPSKRDDAMALGAHEVVVSTDAAQMKAQRGRLDLIIDTVAVAHDLDAYLRLLRRSGVMTLVGAPPTPHPPAKTLLLMAARRSLAGSMIGGIRETQEMLDFCGAQGIVSEIETIAMKDINAAYERMLRSDVRYRFVIDMATLD